jgi:hypothetical protein
VQPQAKPPTLRGRLDDTAAAADPKVQPAEHGFPAAISADAAQEILLRTRPSIFAPAVELELWRARRP